MEIRRLRTEDCEALAKIFSDSILQSGEVHYSAEQRIAWASFSRDLEEFRAWLEDAMTLVAVDDDGTCVGFGGLQPQGRVSSLFVAPQFQRRGIASGLLERLLAEARSREIALVTAEASEFSRPLFEKYAFTIREVEHVCFKDVDFTRYAMETRI